MLLEGRNFGVQEPSVTLSNGTFTLITPFYINNTGFYDISDVNLTVVVTNGNQTLSKFSEILPRIPAKQRVESNYTLSLDLDEIFTKDKTLLTNNTNLDTDVSASFTVAYAITFGVSVTTTVPWDAPFCNLTVSAAPYDALSQKFLISIGFHNKAMFPVNGNFTIELYNNENDFICSANQYIDVSPETHYQTTMELLLDDPTKMTDNGIFRIYFNGIFLFEEGWDQYE